MVDYDVIYPDQLYRGRTYSSLVCDWFGWFLSIDADKRNLGPVVFLRSKGMPSSMNISGPSHDYDDKTISETYADDPYYPRKYANTPNVRVGAEKLDIYKDQAVFVPIITAYTVYRKPYNDLGFMQEYTGILIDNGDNPPETRQLTIDGNGIEFKRTASMKDFRINTPLFPVVVPETEYGRSSKDFLEESFSPGAQQAIVEGYFVLLTFKVPRRYVINSWASAGRETAGPYFSDLLYEIDVSAREAPTGRGIIQERPERNYDRIINILQEKVNNGEILPDRKTKILDAASGTAI